MAENGIRWPDAPKQPAATRLAEFLASKLSPAGSTYVGDGKYERAEHMISRREVDAALADLQELVRDAVTAALAERDK